MSQEFNGYDVQANREKYPLALPDGTVVGGKYIIGQVLGQGGFGITYKAQDYHTKEFVAIKEYFPDTLVTRTNTVTVSSFTGDREQNFIYGKECFLQEAKTLAEFIGNKNIVGIYNYFEENNTAYFAMEFVEGISLKQYLDTHGGRLGWEEAKAIILPVMDALSAVHAKGIVHRDISPDNICITDSGEIKLLDFGAARYSLGDKSRSLDVVLKHGYAPKEQYTRHGKQGPYTDIYSLGATIYKTITGRIPPDSIDRMENDDLILPSTLGSDVPAEAEAAIVKALAVQPAERFQSMAHFKAALVQSPSGAAAGQPIRAMRAQPAKQPPAKQKKPGAGTLCICIFAPLYAIVKYFIERKKEPKAAKVYGIVGLARTAVLLVLFALCFSWFLNAMATKVGVVNDNTYVNKYFGIQYTVPYNYKFKSAQEYLKSQSSNYYELSSNSDLLVHRYDNSTEYLDSEAISNDSSFYIYTYVYESYFKDEEHPDIESLLDECDDLYTPKNTYVTNVSDYYEEIIGGKVFKCCTVTYYSNYVGEKSHIYKSFYVTEKNGNYFMIEILDWDGNDKNSTSSILSYFSAVK